MSPESEQIKRIAHTVTDRLSELLKATITVTDEDDLVVASSQPVRVGVRFDLSTAGPVEAALRLPLQIRGRSASVIVEDTASGETASPRLMQALAELVVSQVLGTHNLPSPHELKSKFIHDLLRGPVADENDLLREGQILGLDLSRPRAVILIDAANYILTPDTGGWVETSEGWVRRRAQRIIETVVRYFHLPDETICAYIGEGEVAVLKASTSQDLAVWTDRGDDSAGRDPSWANLSALKRAGVGLLSRLQSTTSMPLGIGIGRYHPGIAGLARSYQDARAAISLGSRTQGPNQVYCLDGLGVATFVGVSDERTKSELARHLLSPLDQEPELLEMLHLFFFNNCCPSTTAGQLSIHRNTLSYRLDKVASLTGLDPRRFDDAIQIRLALLLRSLKGVAA